jgi:autotransporter-associated beta strand protein
MGPTNGARAGTARARFGPCKHDARTRVDSSPRPLQCAASFRNVGALAWLVAALIVPWAAPAQTLNIDSGVQTYTGLTNYTVNMSNRCELRVTSTTAPLSGCTINLNSIDAFLILPGIKPSVAVSTCLNQIRVSGATAVADSNCRVRQYGVGSVIIPSPSTLPPLTVYSGPHFTGASSNLSPYVYYNSATVLGAFNANISSFKLKRGYTASLAQNANGSGFSKNYVAADGDMEISLLPSTLDNNVRFVYVTPWRWTAKKGIAGDPGNSLLNVQWWYDWNIDQNSSRDFEYVAIRQQRWWPALGQDWQSRGINTVLGYNEPDSTSQADIAVGDAIYSWPDLLGTGLRVGSPATTDGGWSSWLYPFMSQADAAGLRVDYVAVHYYRCYDPSNPSGAANQMYTALKGIYDQTRRPLWITEWNNGANWTTCADPTYGQQQACISAMINMLDNTPFVERYALYNWVETVREVVTNGVLTPSGVSYRDEYSPIGYVQALPDNGTRSFTQLRFETNTWDTSGYGNNGISAGCPAYTNGHSGQAILFDGANTVVTLPPNVATNNGFSFAAWVQWNGGANWQRIFDFGNSTTHYMFLTPSSGSGTLRFAIANGGSEQRVETAALASGSWQHVAITLNGSTASLYVNGALAAQNTGMSISPANFAPRVNRLGKSQFIADPLFSGLMDEVLITDYALSPAQIARLQTNTPPQFTSSMIARPGGTEGINYADTIAGTATDPDSGDTLTYSKAVGPAWLTVAADGSLSGKPTPGDGGTNYFTVRATDAAGENAFAILSIPVTVLTASGTWTSDASAAWGDSNRWSGNMVATGAGQTANFSTINITADRTVTLDSSRTIGTLRFGDTSGAQSWTLAGSNSLALKLDTGSAASPLIAVTNLATISAAVAGTNGFTKNGPGTLVLTGNNPLSGAVYLDSGSNLNNDGIVRITGPSAIANASLVSIRNNNSGNSTLQVDGSAGDITINGNFSVTYRNNGVVTIENLSGTNIFNGSFQLFQGGNAHTVQSDSGLIVFTGTNQYVGGLVGTRTNYFTGPGNHLVIGSISNSTNGSPISLAKNGAGRLTLAGVNTYTNSTLLNAGTLIVDGTLPAAPLFLTGGTTLGGTGTIYAAVSLPSGSILSPGDSAVGVLTISNNVTLQAGSGCLIKIDKSHPQTNDALVVSDTLGLGGTLTVTNIGMPLAANDTFKVFNAHTVSGNFGLVKLPALGAGLAWNTALLNSGTLSVTAVAGPQFGPVAQTADGNFHFSATGAAGVTYELDAAANIAPPVAWSFVTNAVADQSGQFELWDLQATNFPQRFYRLSTGQ